MATETTALARQNGATADGFSDEQLALIKRTVAEGTTDDELRLFLYTARTRGLDPLLKQIHAVKRQGKMAIQVAIDGYRLIADRTGRYVGNDRPVFEYGPDPAHPSIAAVTVWKLVGGQRCAYTAEASWAEYCPQAGQDFMWKKMPRVMLAKCAEAQALRKAFPHELGGIYTHEEMEQADRQGTLELPRTVTTGEVLQAATVGAVYDGDGADPDTTLRAGFDPERADLLARVRRLWAEARAAKLRADQVAKPSEDWESHKLVLWCESLEQMLAEMTQVVRA